MIKKFVEFGFGNFIVIILGFMVSPLVTRLIEPEQMGKFSMFTTISSFMILILTLGMDQAYGRYFYEEEAENRIKLLVKSMKLPLIANVILAIIIIFNYKIISRFIVDNESLSIIILLCIQIVVSVIGKFSILLIRMEQKGREYSFVQIVCKISYIIMLIIFYKIFKNNYFVLVYATTISTFIQVILSIFIERKHWKNAYKKIGRTTKLNTKFEDIIKYSFPLIFSTAITWGLQSIDKFSLKYFCDYNELGIYAASATIVGLINTLQGLFATFWLPIANESYKKDPNNKELFIKTNKIVTFCMFLICIFLVSFKDIILIILGEKYSMAIYVFPAMLLMPIMYTISETTVMGINFKNKTKYHILIAIISAISNLIANLMLVPKLGAVGAAISTGIAYIIFFITRTIFSKMLYKVDYELTKIYIIVICFSVLVIYSSFNTTNIVSIILSIINLIILLFLYKDVVIGILNKLSKKGEVVNG